MEPELCRGQRVTGRLRAISLRHALAAALAWAAILHPYGPAVALERFDFATPGAPDDLRDRLAAVSLLAELRRDSGQDGQAIYAAALSDYGRILAALYAEGRYSGVISIRIDGREAADIDPLDAPSAVRSVVVSVQPGPPFTFLRARMRPYAPGTEIPPAYADTALARSTAIGEAAAAGVDGWRQTGHAKARVSDQTVVADHAAAQIDSLILLDPGPKLRFGRLDVAGNERLRLRRLIKIAGYPASKVFDPDDLDRVLDRLRRTGVFRSVTATEAERPNADGTLDVAIVVVEETLRRFGFGAEVASLDGLTLSGFWLHRNLFGGGERLRLDGEITGIGGATGGADYSLGLRLDRPASFTPDTGAFLELGADKTDEQDFDAETFTFGFGLTHIFDEQRTAEASILYSASTVTDVSGTSRYRQLSLPLTAIWDRRDAPLAATKGYYLKAEATPFLGFGSTDNGARVTGDLRAYRGFGEDDRLVLAGRVQAGTILGSSVAGTPRDYLFYTGGGGSVRGQPYQSLGVQVIGGGTVRSGGLSFAALSGELRARIGEKLGLVAFYDAGFVSSGDLFGGADGFHAGAGIGLRYDTGIGPIRIDLAGPVAGATGDGVQLYVGIGQSF